MSNLSVNYLGYTLKSPVIVGSSGLTDSPEKIVKLAEHGAGAVVLKSLFQEQMHFEAHSMMEEGQYPEAGDYLIHYIRNNNVETYLKLIQESKKQVGIPVIASINCVSSGEWLSFAKQVEEAGADALELNVYLLPSKVSNDSTYYEKQYLEIIAAVVSSTKIPVSVKLAPHFTNLPAFIDQIYKRGARSVVLFNRFYAPDINIDTIEFTPADIISSPQEMRTTLRWVGILSSVVENIDICASTGIHSGAAVIKQLLAGASAVQVCSAIYKNGPEIVQTLNKEIEQWMNKNTFDSIKQFKGRLNYKRIKDPSVFERSQFMKYYSDKK